MTIQNNLILTWFVFAGIFFTILAIHFFENKKLKSDLLNKCDQETFKLIVHFSWSRSIQFLVSIIILFIIILIYEDKLSLIRQKLLSLQNNQMLEKIINEIEVSDVETNKSVPEPVILEELPEETSGNNIADIFGSLSETENNIYTIKKNYEGLLVNYYLMNKCNKAEKDDYQIITTVLQNETINLSAPANLIDDILIAAKGSYQELYSKIECNDTIIPNIETDYRNYITKLSEKLINN